MANGKQCDCGSRTETTTPAFRSRIDAMYDRMQTVEFAEAALRLLDEQPLRVPVPQHLENLGGSSQSGSGHEHRGDTHPKGVPGSSGVRV